MKKEYLMACWLLIAAVVDSVQAAPTEVLSDVSFIEKGGIDAIKIDFAIPVHYQSHFPAKHGNRLTVKVRFDRNEVPDTSELPLMQSLYAPEGIDGPLVDVVYQTENGEPQLQLNFKRDVNFSVSQIMGISNLIVFLPQSLPRAQVAPHEPVMPPAVHIPGLSVDSATDVQAKKLLDDGRRALRTGKYKTAIQDFTAVLSMPQNIHTQTAMELLGVARERNNQGAHAKAVYDQYLKQYPEGEGAVRVRQRLAELLAAQLKPQKKLEESPRAKRLSKQKTSSKFIGNISQYLDYSDFVTQSAGREVTYTSIANQLSLNWRVRNDDWEFNNYFFGNFDYDTIKGETDGLETSSAYVKIKNRKKGFYSTLGRQLGSAAGALGRFDGAYVGYDVRPKIRLNGVYGYPVEISHKDRIQLNKPMLGFGVDFSDFFKGWDASPFIIEQQVDGITDRRALGTEFRYFDPQFNFFSLLDYDMVFSDINIFLLQSQYFLSKPTSVSLTFDYRKNPFLETSNVLTQLGGDVTVKDLVNGTRTAGTYSESQLQAIAEDRTGFSTILTASFSHEINANHQITADITRSQQSVKVVNFTALDPTIDDILQIPATKDKSNQVDTSVQLVSNNVFTPKDTAINSLRHSRGKTANETSYSLAYRIPHQLLYTTEPRILFRYRKNKSGEKLYRTIPGIRVNYRSSQDLRFYMEMNVEFWNFAGGSQQENFRTTNYYFGYSWTF